VAEAGEERMICCDICGTKAECAQKEIDGREFDLCDRCWRPLADKLKGKGRVKEHLELVKQHLELMEEFEEYEETLI
jgi:hypothetical protein